jgi:hypothetical protein
MAAIATLSLRRALALLYLSFAFSLLLFSLFPDSEREVTSDKIAAKTLAISTLSLGVVTWRRCHFDVAIHSRMSVDCHIRTRK